MHDILDFPYSLYSHVSNQQQQQQALLQNKKVNLEQYDTLYKKG